MIDGEEMEKMQYEAMTKDHAAQKEVEIKATTKNL